MRHCRTGKITPESCIPPSGQLRRLPFGTQSRQNDFLIKAESPPLFLLSENLSTGNRGREKIKPEPGSVDENQFQRIPEQGRLAEHQNDCGRFPIPVLYRFSKPDPEDQEQGRQIDHCQPPEFPTGAAGKKNKKPEEEGA